MNEYKLNTAGLPISIFLFPGARNKADFQFILTISGQHQQRGIIQQYITTAELSPDKRVYTLGPLLANVNSLCCRPSVCRPSVVCR